jgi:nucleoside-diphosphate-sugar epimerase
VTAVSRSAAKSEVLAQLGAHPIRVDLFDPEGVRAAVAGHDCVVNLATKIPTGNSAMLASAWRENDRIRTEVSRLLVDAAVHTGARRYVQESVGLLYADGGDTLLTEDSPVQATGQLGSALVAEAHAARAQTAGLVAVVLRFGSFTGDAGFSRLLIERARAGKRLPLGAPDAWMSPIHVEDAGSAVAAALRAPSGIYNAAADPARRRELAVAIAAAAGVAKVKLVPVVLLRLFGARVATVLRSQRISSQRLRSATGWAPSRPTVSELWLS